MKLVLAGLIFIIFTCETSSQVRPPRSNLNRVSPKDQQVPEEQRAAAREFFDRFGRILEKGTAGEIGPLLHQSVHLALPGVDLGQYSSNQATQLVSSYLADKRISEVVKLRVEYGVASPYLSSKVRLQQNGKTDSLNLYVSLTRSNGGWAIAHLSFY